MRLIIPHSESVMGGIERVTCTLVSRLVDRVDCVILVLPESRIPYFQNLIPASDRVVYKSFSWSRSSWQRYAHAALRRILSKTEHYRDTSWNQFFAKLKYQIDVDLRIAYLAEEHQATHCLYLHTRDQSVPNLPIPIGAVVHDLHWDIFPDKFPQQYRDDRTKNLIEWLTKAGVTFAISEQTKQEITEFYGKQAGKVKTVMLAADTSVTSSLENAIVSNSEVGEPLFYYPASLGFTKNQLTLLQATLRLANQGFRFKVALTGWATEMLLSEQPVNLGYPEICRSFYQTHRDILSQYIEVFGYCELQKVESLYAESACVVLPSIYDGFGLPLPEALLRGIPAICSDIGVYNEQINLYNCHDRVQIFPAKDVDALSQRLESFLTHPLQRLEPQEAQSKFSRWTWNHVAQAYIEGLQESHR